MNRWILLLFIALPFVSGAQADTERDAVVRVIQTLFDGMRAGDSASMRALFHPAARLQTTSMDKNGTPLFSNGSIDRWLDGVAKPKDKILDERIWSYEVQVDQNLATAWTEYSFFLGDQLSHCGVNAFMLFRSPQGWKIFQVTDTRRQDGCKTSPTDVMKSVDDLIDNWHIAAAMADEDIFFGSMSAEGVYIGTDASERWLRDELREWAQKAFERESAWDFKPSDRHIALSSDGKTAWWDEKLDTWMGICRGSGVAALTADGWKIQHYQLSVTVPNDKIRDFIKLVKK